MMGCAHLYQKVCAIKHLKGRGRNISKSQRKNFSSEQVVSVGFFM